MNSKKLSIVVPVYYNEKSLLPLFAELQIVEKKLFEKKIDLELIFVDDGSKDLSLEKLFEIKSIRKNTIIVKLTRNFGATYCSKTGLRFVTGDAFICLAADLQDPPILILEMVESWMQGNKFVICERIKRNDPIMSKLFSYFYYMLIKFLIVNDYPRGGYDLALMDKVFLLPIRESSKSAFIPLLAFWLGYKPKIIKYERKERHSGKSKWTISKKLTTFFDVILGFSIAPIRIISVVGILVAIASFMYGSSVLISAFFSSIPVKGFATVVALITFLLGIVIFMLGFIAEYLVRIFNETNKRPETVIDEIWS